MRAGGAEVFGGGIIHLLAALRQQHQTTTLHWYGNCGASQPQSSAGLISFISSRLRHANLPQLTAFQ